MLYVCNKCQESDYAEEWDAATLEDMEKYGYIELTSITTIDIGNPNECYYYICPNCEETCFNEDGHISVVE